MTGEQFLHWVEQMRRAVVSGPGKGGLVKFPISSAIAELSDEEREAALDQLRDMAVLLAGMVGWLDGIAAYPRLAPRGVKQDDR